jgi:hypothetical protein
MDGERLERSEGWALVRDDWGGLHVVPEGDQQPHALDGTDCPCRPEDDGGVRMHRAWDGREGLEEAVELLEHLRRSESRN